MENNFKKRNTPWVKLVYKIKHSHALDISSRWPKIWYFLLCSAEGEGWAAYKVHSVHWVKYESAEEEEYNIS